VKWCLLALAAYAAKVVLFGLSTGTSHAMAYTILDEATASIDPENEHLIQQAISALTRGKAIITIAHRLATVQNADQILVVDDGRIAHHGTHDQLVKQEGLYRRFTAIRQLAEGWRIAAE
jgi:ATP-binding cassette subfamily B protein